MKSAWKNTLVSPVSNFFAPHPRLLAVLCVIGLLLRAMRYLHDQAMWLDEAWVALDILNRSFFEIITSESYTKPVPLGFALLIKMIVSVFGSGEYAFRAFSLFSGIVSLVFFLKFLQRFADPKAVPIAYAFFVFCDPLIYYSAELKYYSSDVMITLGLYLIAFPRSGIADHARMLRYALAAAAAVWFSHTALFIVLSIAVFYGWRYRHDAHLRNAFWSVQLLWMLSFLFVYFISLRRVERLGGIHSMWEEHFWPWPFWSSESLSWLGKSCLEMFSYPGGFFFSILAAGLFAAGLVFVWRRDKGAMWALVLPFFVALVAAGSHKYPFSGRLLLFLVPFILYFIGEGLAVFFRKRGAAAACGIALIVLLGYHPVHEAFMQSIRPIPKEDIRPIVRFVAEHQKEGDEVYINNSAIYPFLYYFKHYDMFLKPRITKVWMDYLSQDQQGAFIFWAPIVSLGFESMSIPYFEFLDGEILREDEGQERAFRETGRGWVVISHAGEGMEDYLLRCLDRVGQRQLELKDLSASGYLYDFAVVGK